MRTLDRRSKAAGPVARVLRDAMLPMILKRTAGSKALKETYDRERIADFTTFLDPELLPRFGLPDQIEPHNA